MNLSDTTSPEATPQKEKHSRRKRQFLGLENLDLSNDSEQKDLVTQNEKLKQENEQLRKRLKRLQEKKIAPPVLRQTRPPKPWCQLSNRWKRQLVKEMNSYNVYQLSTYDKVLDLPFLYIANRWRKSQ